MLQERVKYLPYETHPIIRLLRAMSHMIGIHLSLLPSS